MTATFTVSGKIIADAKALVASLEQAASALDELTAAEKGAKSAAADLNKATDDSAKSQKDDAQATDQNAGAKRRKKQATDDDTESNRKNKKSQDDSKKSTEEHAKAQSGLAKELGLNRGQFMELQAAARHAFEALAAGASPLRVLALEGPKVSQAFGGPSNAIKGLTSLLTPARLAVGATAAAVFLGIKAWGDYEASVTHLNVALDAHGGRLGLTRQGYLDLGGAIATTAGVSAQTGREIEAAFVSGAAQSKEAVLDMAAATKGFAAATGKDAKGAAEALAQALKDPAKGAHDLASEYGFMNQATIEAIETAQRQGDTAKAQLLLAQQVVARFHAAGEETNWWARQFDNLGIAASNAWNNVGKFLSGGPPAAMEDQLTKASAELDRIQHMTEYQLEVNQIPADYVDRLKAQISVLKEAAGMASQWRQAAADQTFNDDLSRRLGEDGRRLDPRGAQLKQLTDDVERYNKAIDDPRTERPNRDRALEDRRLALIEIKKLQDEIAKGDKNNLGTLFDKYQPNQKELQEIAKDIVTLNGIINDPSTSPDKRIKAEQTLHGVMLQQRDLQARIAKEEKGPADPAAKKAADEAARLAKRNALDETDLGLLQQIVAARLAGNDALANNLQGKRDASRQGFDLATPEGQAQAEVEARRRQAEETLRAINDVDQAMGQLDDRFTPGAASLRYEADIKAAEDWRDKQIAAFNGTAAAQDAYAAKVELIYRDRMAAAYDADLHARRDWAAGVERGFRDIEREQQDYAAIAEKGIKDLTGGFEDDFVQMLETGKASFDDLTKAFEDMLLRMAYAKYAAPGIDSLFSDGVGWLGKVLGLGGGGGGGGGSAAGGDIYATGWHSGGDTASDAPTFARTVPARVFAGAPRYHKGLGGDEFAAILQRGERVLTEKQQRNAMAYLSSTNQPIMIQAAPGAAGGHAPIEVNLAVHGGDSDKATKRERRNATGGMDIDLFLDGIEDRIAGNVTRGRSPLNQAFETTYGAARHV